MRSHFFLSPIPRPAGPVRGRARRVYTAPRSAKRRFLPAVLPALLLCAALSACRSAPQAPIVTMDTQYYDQAGNYIEIPTLTLPGGQAVEGDLQAINRELELLKAAYQPVLDHTDDGPGENHCLFYPSTTQRYLNLVFFREEFTTDMNTGHVLSLVYDLREGRRCTIEDALSLAGTTQQALFEQLSAQIDPTLSQDTPVCVQSPVLEGFRMNADGAPVFYLTARIDDVDPAPDMDNVSGADQLFIWSDGVFQMYDQYSAVRRPLVPGEETDQLSPPLWCQWYFEGGDGPV